jgi:hypothetical protein
LIGAVVALACRACGDAEFTVTPTTARSSSTRSALTTTRWRPRVILLQHPDRHDLARYLGERIG